MQKYFTTEINDAVFQSAKIALEKKETIVPTVIKPPNPYEEIDQRNAILEQARNQLATKSDSKQKLIQKPVTQITQTKK